MQPSNKLIHFEQTWSTAFQDKEVESQITINDIAFTSLYRDYGINNTDNTSTQYLLNDIITYINSLNTFASMEYNLSSAKYFRESFLLELALYLCVNSSFRAMEIEV